MIVLFFSYQVYTQVESFGCGSDALIEESSVTATIGGKYKPSSNAPGEYFRALYVFAQFASDTKEISNWPKNSLPDWAYDFVDQQVAGSYSQFTVSEYFDVMSEGNFDFIGDIHPNIITVQQNKYWTDANVDVINQLNNQISDFKRYDNWYFADGAFHFSASNGDGYIDMLHIIYRWADCSWFSDCNNNWGGNALLGFSGTITLHDGIKVNGNSLDVLGSGITTNNKASVQSGFSFTGHIAHEYGHYLFGGGHPRESGVMANGTGGGTFAMSALERETLGYITMQPVYNGQTKTISDYLTTGDALKISVSSTEYFIVENHRRLNHYDQIIRGGQLQGALDPNTTIGQGMYIWHVSGTSYPWTIEALTADGSWEWEFVRWETMTGWGGSGNPDPVVAVLDRDVTYKYLPTGNYYQTGMGDRNGDLYVNINGSYQHWPRWHDIDPLTKEWWISRDCMGDETDAFKIGYNDQITPWSNPSTTKLVSGSETPTNISIKLASEDAQNNQITVTVYTTQTGALLLPPSKPQNLKVSLIDSWTASLTWEANTEPDVITNGKYKIYRGEAYSGAPSYWEQIALINAYSNGQPVTSFIDDEIGPSVSRKVFYKISAVDNTQLESLCSDYDWVSGRVPKIVSDSKIQNIEYSLEPNYPNPFNPSTQISYSIKEAGLVQLKIYDILGKEVANLVNERKEVGHYSVNFNASKLPSGVYIYRITTNSFTQARKMILTK